MYGIVLAALLTTGPAGPGGDTHEAIRDLRKAINDLRKEQTESQVRELQPTIAGLRQRLLEQKIDELRRDIDGLRYEPRVGVMPLPVEEVPVGPSPRRALVHLQLPAGASLKVNDREMVVSSLNPTFITPALDPGRDYHYDFAVTVVAGGKTVTRGKRVPVRPGAVVRVTYEEMTPR